MTTLLEARHVTKLFSSGLLDRHATVALEDFSLAIDSEQSSITAIVGESGNGKTTLARLLLGLVAPTRGEILYQGQDLQNMAHAAWRAFRRDVQVIFQDPYEVYNPFYRLAHVLATPAATFILAAPKPAARALGAHASQHHASRPRHRSSTLIVTEQSPATCSRVRQRSPWQRWGKPLLRQPTCRLE